MIIKNKIDNEPVLSNVGQVGEFRIRNSAKAFSILSSGLYANKIRAVIREYSCNAVDSHVEAGRETVPFDVHLPNALEPWFSVRDYGVGLDEQQVRNIFTTYFESSKTATDELIGGLGLGSKSAFSITDNFTIVAVKNGVKRVYTAFINDQGVPSIAPMGEEASTEPSGVEIRFAIENSLDFRKFVYEAQHVFKHFKNRPVVSGAGDFEFTDPEYEDRDIIPGIHALKYDHGSSYAIMGNIEYPIQVPNNADLGGLERLLKCGIVIEFGIGELDIQASREGLSYIPETISAIKAKLEALNAALAEKLAEEVNAVPNEWQKAYVIDSKANSNLWSTSCTKFIADTKFELVKRVSWGGCQFKTFEFDDETLEKKFNIKISAFTSHTNYNSYTTTGNYGKSTVYDNKTSTYIKLWNIKVGEHTCFVENDTKTGTFTRAKYHWRTDPTLKLAAKKDTYYVFVLEKADRNREMNTKAFFKAISNPPANQQYKASGLLQQERAAGIARDVSILKLERRDHNGHMRSADMVWRDAGKLASFDDANTYYYLPMSGFKTLGAAKLYDMKTFAKSLNDSGVLTGTLFGVRKADLEEVKKKANWVELDSYIISKLSQGGAFDVMSVVKKAIDVDSFFRFDVSDLLNQDSPYLKFFSNFKDVKTASPDQRKAFEQLCVIYKIDAGNIQVTDIILKYKNEMEEIRKRYPIIGHIDKYYRNRQSVADYINAIDLLLAQKKVDNA